MSADFSVLKRALKTVAQEAAEHAENTLILHADLPIAAVATEAVKSLDADLRAELVEILLPEHFIKLVRIARRKQSAPKPRPLPGFEHLPIRIQGRKKIKPIQLVTWVDMEFYVRHLSRQSRETEKYKEAVKLRDRLKRRKGGAKAGDLFGLL
jgi:hypothetical protein